MNYLEVIFWGCLACVVYTYAAYPLLAGLRARLRPRPTRRAPYTGSLSIVLAAHNEEATVAGRLIELSEHIARTGLTGEIIVVSDGSTDATAERARACFVAPVHVIELPDNVGKAAALTTGCQSAHGDIVVFADARQTWADDALVRLLENFADEQVGAVSGDLVLQTSSGVMAGVGLYWRFEKWLRQQESLASSQVGVTGAISAVRRALFQPIPAGIVLDDVYWPLRVALAGRRVIHDTRAVAYDRLPERSRDEFRRKVRTLSGNYQLAFRLPRALLPWRNPVWLAWISHKLLRLVVPWALLGVLVTSMLLREPLYQTALIAQALGYGLALAGMVPAIGKRVKWAGAAGSFLVLNGAAWLAFWVWLTGRTTRSWRKVHYGATREAGQEACSLR